MILYVLQTQLIWLMSLLIYYFLLRKSTFFQINRFFLMASLLSGLIIPACDFSFLQAQVEPTIEPVFYLAATVVETIDSSKTKELSSIPMFYYIFFLISFLFMLRQLREAIYISYLKRKAKKIKFENYNLLETSKLHTPFSVFNSIFISGLKEYTALEKELLSNMNTNTSNKNTA